MIPELPAAAIREAIGRADWSAADELLAAHESALRAALDSGSAAESNCRAAWIDLLSAQRALIEDLRGARDEAGRALERLGQERRGVAAYLKNAG